MYFTVADEIFSAFPAACFGVVVAKDIQLRAADAVGILLDETVRQAPGQFSGAIREHPRIRIWRDALTRMGCNPNKFMSSAEALHHRALKTGKIPRIHPVVDLVNAMSLRYIVPMGAHDIDRIEGGIMLRMSREGDVFIPFGAVEPEAVPVGEIVYADSKQIRTRRWVWRQGERAKVGPDSHNIFFPIDGFSHETCRAVKDARDALAGRLKAMGSHVTAFWLDRNNPGIEWD